MGMRVISRKTLREHWETPGRGDSEDPLRSWHKVAKAARWTSPADIKAVYGNASIVGDRVVFNIAGNKYRLVVWADYARQALLVKFVGTHGEYDAIDVRTIGEPEET